MSPPLSPSRYTSWAHLGTRCLKNPQSRHAISQAAAAHIPSRALAVELTRHPLGPCHGLVPAPCISRPAVARLHPISFSPNTCPSWHSLPPQPDGSRSLRGKLGHFCIDSSGTPGCQGVLNAGGAVVRMAEAYAFMVPAGGTVCCLATGRRCCCCCCGNCGPGQPPHSLPSCVRLTLLLEVIRLGYLEVGQWLCTSDWVMHREDVCPQPSKIPIGNGWFEELPITLKGTPSGYRRWSSKGKKPSNISRRQRCRGRRKRVRTS